MLQSPSPDNQQLQLLELFGEYLRGLRKKGDEEKVKLAEKIFFETYYENIQEGMNPKVAFQKAITVAFCFLIESHKQK
jgi:hypothetical protein